MRITVARSYDLDGLYVDGILAKSAEHIDIDDVLLSAGREKFTMTKKYLDEDWVRLNGYTLPLFEINLVELDT